MKDPIQTTIQGYSNSVESYKKMRSDLSVDEENRQYFVDHLKGKKILDVGCAHGRDVGEFCKKGMDVTGIDLTPEFIAMVEQDYPNVDARVMDMRYLTFEDETFDGLWACASLLHIPKNEVEKTVLGFHRVLKKGGLLFVAVKEGIGEDFDEWDRFFSDRQLEEMETVIKQCGFSIQKGFIRMSNGKPWVNVFAIAE